MSAQNPNEATQLRRKLRAYISQAKENERKLGRLQDFEIDLISANGLRELLDVVINGYRDTAQLQSVSLLLLDSKHEIRHLITEMGIDQDEFPALGIIEDKKLLPASTVKKAKLWLGSYDAEKHAHYFAGETAEIQSLALLPLIRNKVLLGYLNLGSNDADRYLPGTGSAFLERLARFISVCFENAINHEKVKRLGLVDPLTGAYNRRYFDQRLLEEIRRSLRSRIPVSCLYLDIDHFKKVNDDFGHLSGDVVLGAIADIIRKQLRSSDVLARYGGEEFVLLIAESDAGLARDVAERVRQAVGNSTINIPGNKSPISVTVSVGCAILDDFSPSDAELTARNLINNADNALYKAKNEGRNRVIASE